jgi:hypothetical protein
MSLLIALENVPFVVISHTWLIKLFRLVSYFMFSYSLKFKMLIDNIIGPHNVTKLVLTSCYFPQNVICIAPFLLSFYHNFLT